MFGIPVTLIVYGLIAVGAMAAFGGFVLHERNIGEAKGEAKIQAKWDADKQARIKAFSEMTTKWIVAQTDAEKLGKERDEEHARMAADAAKRRASLPAAVADTRVPLVAGLLNDVFVPDPATASGAAKQPEKGAAAGAASSDTTVGLWIDWSITMKDLYATCRDTVIGWQAFYQSLRDKQGKQEGR